jgi:acyl-CoA dehydrogenase
MTHGITLTQPISLTGALAAVDAAAPVISGGAARADRAAAFPREGVAALRDATLLAAAVPREYGGHGFDARSLAEVATRLGGLCGSTAMIWAMHQLQVACLARVAGRQDEIAGYLRLAARAQHLIASVTSEEGVGGNLRVSKAAAVPRGDDVEVVKRATTVSYAEDADSFLVTARRGPDAAPGDQVLVLALASQVSLERTGVWDSMGMRGTCSAPQLLTARVPAGQVLAEPFGEIAGRCMVPLSHLLWAAVWSGIAEDALRRAARFVRARSRAGTFQANPTVGWIHARCQLIKDSIRQFAADYAAAGESGGFTVRANALKMMVSMETVRIAEGALEVCGMAGYSELGEFSVSRHLRDLYSARLMVSNDKLCALNSEVVPFGENSI